MNPPHPIRARPHPAFPMPHRTPTHHTRPHHHGTSNAPPTRTPRRLAAALCIATLSAAGLAGCVTERVERPAGSGSLTRAGQPVRPADSASAQLPDAPVAAPARSASTVRSAVRVGVQPIGTVDFDGQVLPHLSPNGKHLATQAGQAPDWPTILALDGATAPRTRIVAHQLPAPADTNTQPRPIDWPESTSGLLLGRTADARGTLVEAPRPDGSRWIGVIAWATGQLEWLVTTRHVNAHAVLVGDTLAWSQRDIAGNTWTIVCRDMTTGQEHAVRAASSLVFPLITRDERWLVALSLGPDRLRALTHPIERAAGRFRVASPRARIDLGPIGDGLIRAYQATQPVQLLQPTHDAAPNDALLIFHPGIAAMAIIDAPTGELIPLHPRSIAAAWNIDTAGQPDGVFLCTPDGLMHQPLVPARRGPRLGEAGPTSRVLAEPFVPRTVSADPARSFVLLGPAPRQPNRLTLMGMTIAPGPEAQQPAANPGPR